MTSIERIESLNKKLTPNTEDTSEQQIREIVRKFVFDGKTSLEEDAMLREIISLIKCDLKTAKAIIQQMKDLGLDVCRSWVINEYLIELFANIRGYLSDEEIKQRVRRREEASRKAEEEERQMMEEAEKIEQEYIEKYGSNKFKWPSEVFEKYLEDTDYYY